MKILLTLLATVFLSLAACSADDPGVVADDQPDEVSSTSDALVSCYGSPMHCKLSYAGARAVHVQPCGLWWSPTSVVLADARHTAAPLDPDMTQLALPGGLSCSALIAAAPAVVSSQGGAAVVYYVSAPGLVAQKPIKPGTRWCAWPPSCTNPDAACCTATCVQIGEQTLCSND